MSTQIERLHVNCYLFVCKAKGRGVAIRYREERMIEETKVVHDLTDRVVIVCARVFEDSTDDRFERGGHHSFEDR